MIIRIIKLSTLILLSLNYSPFYGQEKEKSNVLFIAVDDLNNYVNILKNHPGIITPNLNRFSKRSINFTKAYCPSPVCNPSRIAVLTGKSPSNTGLYQLEDAFVKSSEAVNSDLIPELFKKNNYTTMWSGKIFHTGGSTDQTRPNEQRLAAMWDDMHGHDGGYGPMPTVENIPLSINKPVWFNYQQWEGEDTDFPDVINTNYTIDRLQKIHTKPFFMALGLYRPHNPWTVPQRFFNLYPEGQTSLPLVVEDDLQDLPDIGKEWANYPLNLGDLKQFDKWKPTLRAYLAAISFMDYNIGRVLDALDKSAYKDNTIVVLWSDNGFHMGEKHHFAKQALWEQSTQVLLMISIPEATNQGSIRSQPVNLLDIYPTLLELCNLSQPIQKLDGQSLVPIITDSEHQPSRPSVTYYKYGSISIRTDNYRYIRYFDGSEELYNELSDSLEINNLAPKKEYRKLMDSIAQWVPDKVKLTVTKIK